MGDDISVNLRDEQVRNSKIHLINESYYKGVNEDVEVMVFVGVEKDIITDRQDIWIGENLIIVFII